MVLMDVSTTTNTRHLQEVLRLLALEVFRIVRQLSCSWPWSGGHRLVIDDVWWFSPSHPALIPTQWETAQLKHSLCPTCFVGPHLLKGSVEVDLLVSPCFTNTLRSGDLFPYQLIAIQRCICREAMTLRENKFWRNQLDPAWDAARHIQEILSLEPVSPEGLGSETGVYGISVSQPKVAQAGGGCLVTPCPEAHSPDAAANNPGESYPMSGAWCLCLLGPASIRPPWTVLPVLLENRYGHGAGITAGDPV